MFEQFRNYAERNLGENALANQIGSDAVSDMNPTTREAEAITLLTKGIQKAYRASPDRVIAVMNSLSDSDPELPEIVSQLRQLKSVASKAFDKRHNDEDPLADNPMDANAGNGGL